MYLRKKHFQLHGKIKLLVVKNNSNNLENTFT